MIDTVKIAEALRFVDETAFPNWEKRLVESPRTRASLEPILEKLKRARREFDSRLFFVVIFGPVKSGKSTLVNSLAREYVSPTKFAREGTRRASIVIKGTTPGIDQYFSKYSFRVEEEEARNDFELVIESLRGIISEERLLESVRKESYPYSPQNVDHLLSEDLPREPLLTVIRTAGRPIFTEEVAILDVPGLDGKFSNARKSPELYWILDKADFLLFTQSSFAPLNNETSGFLNDLYEESRRPPIWLIQNKVEAKHWLPEEAQRKEAEEQIENAKREISQVIHLDAESMPCVSMNLGKAYDGIFMDRPDWLLESRFKEFERSIGDELNESRIQMRTLNCLNEMSMQIETAREGLKKFQARKSEQVRACGATLKRLGEIKLNLSGLNYKTEFAEHGFQEFLETELTSRIDACLKQAPAMCQRAFDRLAKNPETGERDPNRQFSGKEINQFLREVAAEFGRELAGDRFDLNGEIGASLRVRLNKLAKDTEFTSFGQTRSALETLGLDLGPEPPTIDITAMPTFSKRPVQLRQFKERKLAFGFIPWRIRYPFGAVEGRFEMDMPGELKAIFDERVRQWIERIKARYYRACFETRFQPMMRHLENLIAEQARRSQEAATEEREALHVTEVVNPNLEELESLVDLCSETNVFPATSEK